MENEPAICAVVGRTRHKMVQIEIQEAAKRGAKLIELRLDFLAKTPDFKRLLADKPCPLIATFRRPEDGGRWSGTEEERLILIRSAIVSGFDYVDLETDIADSIRRFGKVKRIVSYHNMVETPDDLETIYETMCKQDADIVKIAVTAQQACDNLRVLNLLKNAPKPTVAFCMGDLGTCSRMLAVKFGAPFTYGAFNKERSIAPGILSFQELQKIYFLEKITPETRVFGVIGDPIAHSLSPLIHNYLFRKLGYDGMYVPFRVPRGELPVFLRKFQALPVSAYSVTIPHKEQVAKFAAEKGPAVGEIGAANTLVFDEGVWKAYNTDAQAAMESLKANLPEDSEHGVTPVSKRTVLLLGAGGVARAIAHGLKKEGANLVITNRTPERAKKLAEEVGCRMIDWAARHSIVVDTVINCTSVGMHPNLDESPVHSSFLKPGTYVFDTIYIPETTLFIREAQQRGCHVLTGVDMFVRQAALQFRFFTGLEPPLDLMTAVVRRALSPVKIAEPEESKSE